MDFRLLRFGAGLANGFFRLNMIDGLLPDGVVIGSASSWSWRCLFPAFDQSVEVCPVKQQLSQFPGVGEGNTHPRHSACGFQIPHGPFRYAEIDRCGMEIQQPWTHRNHGQGSRSSITGSALVRGFMVAVPALCPCSGFPKMPTSPDRGRPGRPHREPGTGCGESCLPFTCAQLHSLVATSRGRAER